MNRHHAHPLGRQASGLAVAALLGLAPAAAPGRAMAQLPPLVEMRVPSAPTAAATGSGSVVVYELHFTNFTITPLTIARLEVLAGGARGRTLLALEDSALALALARPGAVPVPALLERARLGGGVRAIAFLWFTLPAGAPPDSLHHRLTLQEQSGDSTVARVLEGAAIPLSRDVAVIGPPLRGGAWLTGNGPDPNTGHRRALIPVAGRATIAQRFAIDYVVVDSGGATFRGDRERNENYHAHGREVIAVADGIVVDVKDGIPENVPGIASRAVPITLETVGGNYVTLDIGQGRYAFFAHLIPGSLRVKPGDRVRRGQVLGLVGNSGNSTEPHLHFHVSDAVSPLAAEGIPYVHDAFEVVGRCTAAFSQCAPVPRETRRNELPVARLLVHFP